MVTIYHSHATFQYSSFGHFSPLTQTITRTPKFASRPFLRFHLGAEQVWDVVRCPTCISIQQMCGAADQWTSGLCFRGAERANFIVKIEPGSSISAAVSKGPSNRIHSLPRLRLATNHNMSIHESVIVHLSQPSTHNLKYVW